MNEIAKCPLCGKEPDVSVIGPHTLYSCCGCAIDDKVRWNQYAAAMELAIRYVESVSSCAEERQAHIAIGDHPDWLSLAQQRVLEVFTK